MRKGIIIAVVALVVIGVGAWLFMQDAKNPDAGDPFANKSSRDLALLCEPQEYIVSHLHPVMSITINGQKQVIPANIGIEGLGGNDTTHEQATAEAACLHFLHTHDASGTLHVESPVPMDYRLSDFFAVWGKTFTKDQILDSKVDDKHRIRIMVDGKESNEFENVVLKDKENIEIFYEAI